MSGWVQRWVNMAERGVSMSDKDNLLRLIDEVELVQCDDRGKVGWIYFIVCSDTGRCKIGFTAGEVKKRLKALQTGSPSELAITVMHPGTPDTERRLHEKFAPWRLHGEWFRLSDELRAYMTVVLWSMSEIALSQGRKLEPWMSIGLEVAMDHLEVMPDSLIALLEEGRE